MRTPLSLLLALASLVIVCNAAAQTSATPPTLLWEQTIGQYGCSLEDGACTPDGGYTACGRFGSFHQYPTPGITIVGYSRSVSNNGSVLAEGPVTLGHELFPGGPYVQWPSSLHSTNGGLFVGEVDTTNGQLDVMVSLNGIRLLGGSSYDRGQSGVMTQDGGAIIVGETSSNDGNVSGNHGGSDAWVAKLDANGTVMWQRCLGGSDVDQATGVAQRVDGTYVVVGETWSNNGDVSGNHGGGDSWAVALSTNGTILWSHCYGSTAHEKARSVAATVDGGIVILSEAAWSFGGDVSGHHGGNSDMWMIKVDANGTLLWQRCYGGLDDDTPSSVRRAEQDGFILCGSSNSDDGDVSGNHGGYDVCLFRVGANGELLWQKSLGGSADDNGANADQSPLSARYFVAGSTYSSDGDIGQLQTPGWQNGWIVGLSDDDVGIAEKASGFVSACPNPTKNTVVLSVASPNRAEQVLLLDAIGRTVFAQSTVNISGPITLDLNGQEDGLYLVKVLFADGQRATERVVKE